MADKQAALSIVIRTVDQATAKINAITKRVETLNKPYKDLGEAFGKLADKSGFNAVVDGFKGVGSAIGDVLGKVALIGGVAALATVEVFKMVGEFATLGHTAERAGVEVDFLAGMRYAAEKSGVSVETLDDGILTLTQNLGQASAGTGRMLKFLQAATGPVFTKQIVSAHNTQEAIGLLADAMAKLPDASKRAALAQKTFGSRDLAPMLAMGSKGVMTLMSAYARLAGSQEAAVRSSLEVESSMVDLKAVTTGVKASIVSGLAPALKVIVDKLTVWFVAHRADVEIWAKQIGDELPGAVDKVVKKVGEAIDWTTKFVDKIGGLKTVAIAAGLIIAGPLISALVTLSATLITTVLPAIIAFSAALIASPAGPFILAMAAMGAAIVGFDALVGKSKESTESYFDEWGFIQFRKVEALSGVVERQIDSLNRSAANSSFLTGMQSPSSLAPFAPPAPRIPPGAFGAPSSSDNRLTVNFTNAPKGMRVTADPRNTAALDFSVGSHMFGAP